MNIAVILRQVPDTEAVIDIDPGNPAQILDEDVKFVMNPYDEYAVEEALTVRDELDGEVIAICIGPERAEPTIRTALAMGVDRAVHVSEDAAVNADLVTQGRIIAEVIRGLDCGLVFCGREMIDTQEDGLGAIVAEYLDMPNIANATRVELNGDRMTVHRDVEGGMLAMDATMPLVLSCQKGLNDPRYPNVIAVRRAKSKEIRAMSLADLGLDPAPPKTRIVTLLEPPARPEGRQVSGEPDEVVNAAIQWLKDETKLI